VTTYVVSTLALTVGLHRLFAHKSFNARGRMSFATVTSPWRAPFDLPAAENEFAVTGGSDA
jgi:fatty-acid desaturase